MTRDELVAVMRAHCRQPGIRDMRAHCSCGWRSDRERTPKSPWAQYQDHLADVIVSLYEADLYDVTADASPDPVRTDAPVLDWYDT
jgi:hypothetical protein